MALRVTRLVNLVSTAVLAGILVDFWAFVEPALGTLSAAEFTRVQQALNRRFLVPAPVLYSVVMVSATLVVALLAREHRGVVFALSLAGLAFSAVATAITLLVNVPINLEVLQWSAAAPPADWAQVRARWVQANAARATAMLLGLGCQVLAVLLPARGQPSAPPARRAVPPG